MTELTPNIKKKEVVKLLQDIIQIPSITGEERECAEYLRDFFKDNGFKVLFDPIDDRRANVIASNYPGTTIDFSEGRMNFAGATAHVIDAPGTYSLQPTNKAEEVSVRLLDDADVKLCRKFIHTHFGKSVRGSGCTGICGMLQDTFFDLAVVHQLPGKPGEGRI